MAGATPASRLDLFPVRDLASRRRGRNVPRGGDGFAPFHRGRSLQLLAVLRCHIVGASKGADGATFCACNSPLSADHLFEGRGADIRKALPVFRDYFALPSLLSIFLGAGDNAKTQTARGLNALGLHPLSPPGKY